MQNMFGINIIFLIFFLAMGIATVLLIPRDVYKRYFLYGFVFGGIGDTIAVITLTHMNFLQYKNMGVFNLFGYFSIWTPLTWMFNFMLFFYYLPVRKVFLILYIMGFSFLSYAVGIVKSQFGIFEFIGINRYIAPLIFMLWYGISAWVYIQYERRTALK